MRVILQECIILEDAMRMKLKNASLYLTVLPVFFAFSSSIFSSGNSSSISGSSSSSSSSTCVADI